MRAALVQLRDLLLPASCAACGVVVASDYTFCLPCWGSLRWITDPRCAQCGEPFAQPAPADARCLRCRLLPPPWRQARAPWDYTGAARTMILRFKSGRRPDLTRFALGPLSHAAAPLLGERPLVIPVPLHRWRLWRRGYNQAALLAKSFAEAHSLPLLRDGLIRTRATAISHGLGVRARQRNVAGAFAARAPELIAGRAILLIDDVLTSGATAAACTKSLMKAGARHVDILTLARVVRHPHSPDSAQLPHIWREETGHGQG